MVGDTHRFVHAMFISVHPRSVERLRPLEGRPPPGYLTHVSRRLRRATARGAAGRDDALAGPGRRGRSSPSRRTAWVPPGATSRWTWHWPAWPPSSSGCSSRSPSPGRLSGWPWCRASSVAAMRRLLSIHQLVAVFPDEDAAHVRRSHRSSADRPDRLPARGQPPLDAVAPGADRRGVIALDPQTRQQQVGPYRSLLDTCIDMTANRAQIEATTGQSLQPIEWIGLLLLLLILMALIVVLPGGTVVGSAHRRRAGRHAGDAGRAAPQARPPALARAQLHLGAHGAAVPEHGPAPVRAPAGHRQRSLPPFGAGPGCRLPGSVPQPVDEDRHARRSLLGLARRASPWMWRPVASATGEVRLVRRPTMTDVTTSVVPVDVGHPLAPYFPRLAIEWIRSDPERMHQELEGTIAFVDISGFTKLSERLARLGKVGRRGADGDHRHLLRHAPRPRRRQRWPPAQVRRRRAAGVLLRRGPRGPGLSAPPSRCAAPSAWSVVSPCWGRRCRCACRSACTAACSTSSWSVSPIASSS